jgi:hypothetical protein
VLTNETSHDQDAVPTPWYLEDITQGLSPDHAASLSFTLDELLQNYADQDPEIDQPIEDVDDQQVADLNSLENRYQTATHPLENASENLPGYIDDQLPPYCFFDIDISDLVQID